MTKHIYSVGQVNAYIKNMFAQDFMMSRIYVRGEVSNCKYHTSGHVYFTLKDASGVLQAVMFAGSRKKGLAFRMKEGDKVVVLGAVRIYERDGKYQLYAEEILLEGAGFLYQRFEELKRELAEMGMFDAGYKRPVPRYAFRVGVVTAPTGAAVRDIQNISARRNPFVQLILYPAQVQGEGAAESVVQGIHALEKTGADVLIVGRGGGSIEDLWAFNEEIVARAIFDCPIPVISAVGHETDWTIADYVADMRAPTPSAAAELAVFEWRSVGEKLDSARMMMNRLLRERLERTRERVRQFDLRFQALNPRNQLLEKRQTAEEFRQRLLHLMEQKYAEGRHRLELCASRLESSSPLKKLSGGYAFLTDRNGKRLHSVADLKRDDMICAYLEDGNFTAQVKEVRRTSPAGGERTAGEQENRT